MLTPERVEGGQGEGRESQELCAGREAGRRQMKRGPEEKPAGTSPYRAQGSIERGLLTGVINSPQSQRQWVTRLSMTCLPLSVACFSNFVSFTRPASSGPHARKASALPPSRLRSSTKFSLTSRGPV